MQVRRRDHLASRTVRFEFTVSGETSFPLDMLRFEGAYPSSSEDVFNIVESRNDERPAGRIFVNLISVHSKDWLPVQARWRTFGWRVE